MCSVKLLLLSPIVSRCGSPCSPHDGSEVFHWLRLLSLLPLLDLFHTECVLSRPFYHWSQALAKCALMIFATSVWKVTQRRTRRTQWVCGANLSSAHLSLAPSASLPVCIR